MLEIENKSALFLNIENGFIPDILDNIFTVKNFKNKYLIFFKCSWVFIAEAMGHILPLKINHLT